MSASHPTLLGSIWPVASHLRLLRAVILMLLGTALLTLSAKIQVPFWPVPMTMQTYVVLVLGMAYGARLVSATLILYLVEGALGLPVFAGTPERGIGIAYMFGPTGGFLIGFVAAGLALGWLAEHGWDRSVARTFAAMLIGHAIIFVLGLAWLTDIVGWERALAGGLYPFWAATLLKTALGAATLPLAWRLLRRG
ncbi:MAG: biotin transporter BioY [Alphaproteobacteria bacterium]|nr:biotin transporter BioY [Alphaproteobacteria bacterium]